MDRYRVVVFSSVLSSFFFCSFLFHLQGTPLVDLIRFDFICASDLLSRSRNLPAHPSQTHRHTATLWYAIESGPPFLLFPILGPFHPAPTWSVWLVYSRRPLHGILFWESRLSLSYSWETFKRIGNQIRERIDPCTHSALPLPPFLIRSSLFTLTTTGLLDILISWITLQLKVMFFFVT
jgi:hypothetical protein